MNMMASLAVPARRARFTTSEFLHMVASDAFGDMKVELIEGELDRMPPPGTTHGRHQMAVIARLLRTVPERLLFAEVGIDLGGDTIVACDAAVLKEPFDGQGMIPADQVVLVVEVAVSSGDRDLGLKRRLYAAAGIPIYWVIDADRRVVHVFDRVEGGDYLGLALVRFGEPLAVPETDEAIVLE